MQSEFLAYEQDYTGGARVAVADLGTGEDMVVTAPGRNRDPDIRFFTIDGQSVPGFPSFLAYPAGYEGGVSVTIADVDGDGRPDLITTPTSGFANVRVFLNRYDPMNPSAPAFGPDPDIAFRASSVSHLAGGFLVAAGDMGQWIGNTFVNQPDGRAEIVVGTGAGTQVSVAVFDVSGIEPREVQRFQPFTAVHNSFSGGVSLEVARVDEDPIPDIIVWMGVNGLSRIEVWGWDTSAASLSLLGAIPHAITGASYRSPVNVAALMNPDGLTDTIVAVQGPGGTTRQIRRFAITNRDALEFQQQSPLSNFHGPWLIATSRNFPPPSGGAGGDGEGEAADFVFVKQRLQQDLVRDAWTAEGEGTFDDWTDLLCDRSSRNADDPNSDDDALFADLDWFDPWDPLTSVPPGPN